MQMPMVMPHPVQYGGDYQYGGDFLGIGNWIKGAANTVYNGALVPVHNFIKDNKIISRTAGLIPHPAGKALGVAAGLAGYGKRRGSRRPARAAGGLSF
jgi:hypothetical protein